MAVILRPLGAFLKKTPAARDPRVTVQKGVHGVADKNEPRDPLCHPGTVPSELVAKLHEEYSAKLDGYCRKPEEEVTAREPNTAIELSPLARRLIRSDDLHFQRSDPNIVSFEKAILELLDRIIRGIADLDYRFSHAILYGVGSYWSGLRVSEFPDELDFNIGVDLGPGMSAGRDEEGRWWVYVKEGSPSWDVWAAPGWQGQSLLVPTGDGLHKVDNWSFCVHFYLLVAKVMSAITLPQGLGHGGPLPPWFTDVGLSRPASTLCLVYQEHTVNVDLAGAVDCQLSALSEQRCTTGKKFSTLCEKPSTLGEGSSAIGQRHFDLGEQLSTSAGEQPSTLGEQHSTLGKQPSTLGEQNSIIGEQPSTLCQPSTQCQFLLTLGQQIDARLRKFSSLCDTSNTNNDVQLQLVPGGRAGAGWILSTAALEAKVFNSLGRKSQHVQAIRDLKLLATDILRWRPTPDMVQQVTATIEAWGEGNNIGKNPVPGLDTEDLAEVVQKSLESGELCPVTPRPGEGEAADGAGEDGRGVFRSRAWLVIAAVFRKHTGVGSSSIPTVCNHSPTQCRLCQSLLRAAGQLWVARLHPAVATALRLPVKPWSCFQTVYLKYIVVQDMVESLLSKDGHSNDFSETEPTTDIGAILKREERLKYYLSKMSRDVIDEISHPLLGNTTRKIYPASTHVYFPSQELDDRFWELVVKLVERLTAE